MRIFINNVDSYVGQALCADLRRVAEVDNKLLGTVLADEKADAAMMERLGVKRVVSQADRPRYLSDVLSCSLIVYDLHTANLEEVEAVIEHLKLAKLSHNTTFVLISSVNVWARTKKEYVPVEDEEDEEEEEPEDGEKIKRQQPKSFTDADLLRRIPPPAFERWEYVETLALSLTTSEKLRTHVISAGILYGNGEHTFNEIFKAAWLTEPTHSILEPGSNFIPCVHVRDVARLVRVVASSEVGPYLIAVDKARLTQRDIVQGIVDEMSHKMEVPMRPAEEVSSDFKDVMMLDLIMEPSAPMQSKDFQWWCKKGLLVNIKKVADEFCRWRRLRPLKAVVMAPPGSGAERLCTRFAEHYLHRNPPHLRYEGILQDALKPGAKSSETLRAKLEESPGGKLSLKTRTRLVRSRLLSNVCRYRGYILEGYPTSHEEAEALFTEVVAEEEGEVAAEENEEEEEEEEESAPPAEDEDEEEDESAPKRRLNKAVAPEFCIVIQSSEEQCKRRIFEGKALGANNEAEFLQKTLEYRRENIPDDGRAGTSDFFSDTAGVQVLRIDIDACTEAEAFQAIRVHVESRGQFFNYLPSDEFLAREREKEIILVESTEDQREERLRQERLAAEELKLHERADEETSRRRVIAESEASLLENETQPLRQYLMNNVVPTLTEGLSEVCKQMPDDPIEYLAQYLFAHAQDIAPQLEAAASRS
mmetsp:Transcript_4867/g.11372  ORF Transcript_4867/g.11372 Transcript_4867/m.11372 type:complete len:704 (-) Transcript_4867:172-2283(-)